MGATSSQLMQRRCIPFASGARLIIDREDGVTRVALYRKPTTQDWSVGIDRRLHKRLTEAGFLPPSQPSDWCRFAHRHGDWRLAIDHVLLKANMLRLGQQVKAYISGAVWVEELTR